MIPNSAITDLDRLAFLQALARASRAKNGLLLDEWERCFAGSFCNSSRPSLWFTQGRRVSTDRLRMKYGQEPEIKMPFPLANGAPVKLPDAAPDGCMFLVHDESNRQVPCNEPAKWVLKNGFRYCDAHHDEVIVSMKRLGKSLHFFNFTPQP
jgi:hypothetical protein